MNMENVQTILALWSIVGAYVFSVTARVSMNAKYYWRWVAVCGPLMWIAGTCAKFAYDLGIRRTK